METIKLWARNGDAVRQAIELSELVHLDTANEECTNAFLLCAIESGLLTSWAESFPEPRQEPQVGMDVILAVPGGALCRALFDAPKRRCAAFRLGVGSFGLQRGSVGTSAGRLGTWHLG